MFFPRCLATGIKCPRWVGEIALIAYSILTLLLILLPFLIFYKKYKLALGITVIIAVIEALDQIACWMKIHKK